MKHNILIVSGEPSGDIRAGELIKELKPMLNNASFWGVGGDILKSEGVELTQHIKDFSIVGVLEAIKKLPLIARQFKALTKEILKRKPSLAILVDYPGFNLKLAKFLKKNNIPVIYYIIPQVWAWGLWRIKSIKENISKALVLFKFEEDLLLNAGIDASFVGHPLVEFASENNNLLKNKDSFTIALLPGSRKSEIDHIFPVILESANIIKSERDNVNFIVAESPNIDKNCYEEMIKKYPSLSISRIANNTIECLNKSDFAIVASGTATLEAAITETPLVIVYRSSTLTAVLARLFMKVSFLGLVNIIAGKEVAPEVHQENLTPQVLANKVLEIISDTSKMRAMKNNLKEVKYKLGTKGSAARAAGEIKKFLEINQS